MQCWQTRLVITALLLASPFVAVAQDREAREENAGEATPRRVMAILIRNPDPDDGAPPFALADQYGRVQRLVEPTPGVPLERHLGERVQIRHDSGRTLLASQLELPERVVEHSPARRVSPAQFIPPQRASRIDEGASADERPRRYAVRPVQATEDAKAGAIDLDSVIAREGVIARERGIAQKKSESLPAPSVREKLEPIPAGSDNYYPETIKGPEMVEGEYLGEGYHDGDYHNGGYHDGGHSYSSGHAADCPHCSVGGSEPYYVEGSSSGGGCNCSKCRSRHSGPLGLGLCKSCGGDAGWCGPTCNPASQPGLYGRIDYLLWWVDGMNTPPLVTTNDLGNAPLLGDPGTRIVYQGELVDDTRNGLRLTAGAWLDNRRDIAIEGDWLVLETETDLFSASDLDGDGVLGRPFYNVARVNAQGTLLGPGQDVQLVAFNEQVGGSLDIQTRSRLQSLGLRLRTGVCCRDLGGCDPCGCASCSSGQRRASSGISRIDFTAGYRFMELEEIIGFNESITQLSNGASVSVSEAFDTNNEFHGVDLGFVYDWQSRRWGLELTSRVAFGNTHQRAIVSGSTTSAGVTTPGGLLAQTSNIGYYERDRFSAIPEVGARLSYRVTPRLSLAAGYTLLYWANVARPGDLIDYSVDGRLASGALTTASLGSHPRFEWEETSLWAHGLDFGLDYRY